MHSIKTLLSTSLLLAPTVLLAVDDSATPIEELFISETVFPQEHGEWQLTVHPEYEETDEGNSFTLPVSIEYGITDQLQVEVEYTPYIKLNPDDDDNESGEGNIEIGLKYSWMNINESGLNIAVGYEHEFATGDDSVIAEEGEPPVDEDAIYAIIAYDYNENTQAFIQYGVEIEESKKESFANLGMFSNFGEYAISTEINWTEEQTFITPGIHWSPEENWNIGIAVPIGVDGESNFRLISNISYEWE